TTVPPRSTPAAEGAPLAASSDRTECPPAAAMVPSTAAIIAPIAMQALIQEARTRSPLLRSREPVRGITSSNGASDHANIERGNGGPCGTVHRPEEIILTGATPYLTGRAALRHAARPAGGADTGQSSGV